MKRISILGSTGSIGTQTLEVARENPDIRVAALAVGSNVDLLYRQILEFRPELVCVYNAGKAAELEERLKGLEKERKSGIGGGEGPFPVPEVMSGMGGLLACAEIPSADMVVAAMVGMIGIRPVLAAIEAGKDIALANKETLVTAGHLILPAACRRGVRLLPVDSEHAAIFQCLSGEGGNRPEKILLTASGGPFRGRTREELRQVTPEDALKHPNWSMGRKITIDSATMVNKGLEVIEASWLFDVPVSRIQVVVQPQSIIHSMVEFTDGSVMAQLGVPDMKLPISYALFYPERRYLPGERLDFRTLSRITFEEPDEKSFPGLKLAYEAAEAGGSMPTVYNAANERAVRMFLNREIGFLSVTEVIRSAMERHQVIAFPDLNTILELEKDTYDWIDGNRRNFSI